VKGNRRAAINAESRIELLTSKISYGAREFMENRFGSGKIDCCQGMETERKCIINYRLILERREGA